MVFRKGLVTVIAVLAVVAGTAACQPSATSDSNSPATASATDVLPADNPHAPVAGPGACHMGGAEGQPLPDPSCTPGAINPDATQATLATTVCKSGWTKTIRPPASYTDQLKREQIVAYGDTDTHSGDYEEDHLVSLELGGAPDDPRNLWPEPGASPNPKDKVENLLHKAVCSGQVTLVAAQRTIASNWTTAETVLGLAGN